MDTAVLQKGLCVMAGGRQELVEVRQSLLIADVQTSLLVIHGVEKGQEGKTFLLGTFLSALQLETFSFNKSCLCVLF